VSFSHPLWLLAGLLACLSLLALWYFYDDRQQRALARFISPHLRTELTQSLSIARRRVRRALLLLSVALLFIALAGPLIGFNWEVINRRGNEIVFAVDTSRSMSTPDVKPDRLTRAKLAIDDFTNQLDGDAVGLVAFAGSAFLVCPITLDYGAFHESLNAIDTHTIPRGGTNIASAIHEAQAALRRRRGTDRILILVTDGEDLEGDALNAAQAAAREDGLKIYTVGVGTPQGELIPVPTNEGSGFVKDDAGGFVKSHLDEPALKAIAAATGGIYAPLGTQGQGFDTIYRTALAPLLKHDVASRRQRVYIQRYQWPLTASLAFLLLSQLVGSRRWLHGRRRRAQRPDAASTSRSTSRTAAASAAPAALLVLFLSLTTGPVRASTLSAEEAYKKGDYATAQREYAAAAQRDPKKPVLQFNAGTAAYRAGQFPEAAKAFQESISRAPSGDAKRLADQEDAYYNLGNTLYRTGQKTEQSSPQQTMDTWTQAVKAYDTALQLRPGDADSKFNRDFVKRKIKDLKDQQNQPQNQPNGSQQNQSQGQPPPGQQPPGQQPPGQQPPGKQPPGQQPPGQQPPGQQPPGQQPPGKQPPGQQPPGQQPQGQQPPPGTDQSKSGNGQPKAAPGGGQPQDGDANQDDTQHAPGQMSREEARELLDSQKSDERHAQGLPYALKQPDSQSDKPIKDW
jgi:Ca-activated chloride channel homolog